MPRLRPRLSLLAAILMTTIVALSIVVIRQHRELSTLRNGWSHLPAYWKAWPQVLDEKKLYARGVVQIRSLLWTWRLWIPSDETVVARIKWGDIPAEGYPDDAQSIDLPTGDNWLALKFEEHPVSGESLGQLFGSDAVISFVVPSDERLSPWWKEEYKTDVIGVNTISEASDGRLLLQRFRVAGDDAPADFAAPGFIIWLERD
jgi:hypothetical protein